MNRNLLLLFAVLGIIVIVMIVISINLLFQSSSSTPQPPFQTTSSPTVTPVGPTPVSKPPIPYNKSDSDQLLEKVENRADLSTQDSTAKQKLLEPFANKSATLQQTNLYIISYVSSADLFQVEILSADISTAKSLATNWFLSKGFSKQGICDLPVMFYLNFSIASSLKNSGLTFNPQADICG